MNMQSTLLTTVLLFPACATGAAHLGAGSPLSYENHSFEGLEVGVARVDCSETHSEPASEMSEAGSFDLSLKIKNDSGRVARFSERRVRLTDSSTPGKPSLTPEPAEAISVFPGETRDLPLRFANADSIDCHHGYRLVLADAVQFGGAPVPVRSLSISVPRAPGDPSSSSEKRSFAIAGHDR